MFCSYNKRRKIHKPNLLYYTTHRRKGNFSFVHIFFNKKGGQYDTIYTSYPGSFLLPQESFDDQKKRF